MNLFRAMNADPAWLRQLRPWTLFYLGIVLLKLLFFAIDPLPKFIMGDSASYIQTAVTYWIPEARSYFYGYIIRWTSVGIQSLTSLLLFQLFLSAVVCILAARVGRIIFQLRLRW